MQLTCPECKNNVDLSSYQDLKAEQIIECNVCGISLLVTSINDEQVEAEVVDEGK